MKADISTLLKPDILILRRHPQLVLLTPAKLACILPRYTLPRSVTVPMGRAPFQLADACGAVKTRVCKELEPPRCGPRFLPEDIRIVHAFRW